MSISSIDPGSEVFFVDNFISTDGNSAWLRSDTGSGTGQQSSVDYRRQGFMNFRSGTSAGSRSSFKKGNNSIVFASDDLYHVNFNGFIQALATVAQDYTLRIGFMNDEVNDPTNGAYFEYNRSLNGNIWTCITNNGGSKTTTTSIAVIVGETLSLKIVVSGSNIVNFSINDIIVASHTTNIPTGSCGIIITMTKTNGSSNIVSWIADQIYFYGKLKNNRLI